MAALFLAMTRKLCAHWKANGNANPKKFMLTSEQHKEYFDSCVRCGADLAIIDADFHMGVPIEVVEDTPGVLIAANGAQFLLR